jgi:hypothetical protein
MAMKWFGLVLQELLDTPGDGGAGGGAAGADAGAGGDAGTGGTGDSKPGADGKQPPVQGGGGNANPWDAEKRGLLADLAKERKTRQEHERRVAAVEAERDTERRRVAAMAGINVPTKDDQARAAIQAEIGEMYPVLKNLSPDQLARVLSVADKAESLEAAVNQQLTNHAQGMIDRAYAGIEKALGGKLSDRQKAQIGRLYLMEAANNADFIARHDKGDVSVTEEFVKNFLDDFVEPTKRNVLAEQTRRQRPVPDGKGRSLSVGGKKIEIKTDKDFADAMSAAYRDQGGQYGD